jgi:hypothetical protein
MRKTSKIVAAFAATVAVMAVGVASAEAAGRGRGGGYGMMNGGGYGMMNGGGYGMMNGGGAQRGRMAGTPGNCLNLSGVETGTVTAAQRDVLAALTTEEKLAHDVYSALAKKFPTVRQFARIAASESRHLVAMRALLKRYAIADPTAGLADGRFADAATQALYDGFVASALDTASALKVGVQIETLDLASLADLLGETKAADVTRVLTMLQRASQMHLRAFSL